MPWIIGIAIVLGALAWLGISEDRAETSAVEFCESVALGSSITTLAQKAESIGSASLRIIRKDSITVGFTGSSPLSRHFCEISGEADSVKEKNYFYLD